MKSFRHRSTALLLLKSAAAGLLLACGMPWLALAEDPQLPKAAELLDKYVEVTGGKAAYAKIKNRVSKATMEITGQAIKLNMTIYAARPNLLYSIMEAEAIGKIESGSDGKVVWENSLIKGPAVKQGAEKEKALRDLAFDRFPHWRDSYEKATTVSREKVNGKPAYKIVLTPKSAKKNAEEQKLTVFLNSKSYLLEKVESNVVTAAGTIPVIAYLSDYKKVDGILSAHKIVTEVLQQKRVTTIHSIKHNVKLPKDRFAPPAEVKALINKK